MYVSETLAVASVVSVVPIIRNRCSTTGAVVEVPETSFNHLHGRLADIHTLDAQQFQRATPNALGVKKQANNIMMFRILMKCSFGSGSSRIQSRLCQKVIRIL